MSAYNMEDVKAALLECVLERYNDIPAEDEIDYTFSEKFERWGKKIIKRTPDKKKQNPIKFNSRSLKVFILVAALIAALTATAMAVPAIREALMDFFLVDRGDHYSVTVNPEQAKDAPDMVEEYRVPQYVPAGYNLIIDDKNVAAVVMIWRKSEQERICFTQRTIDNESDKDTINSEDVMRKPIVMQGYKVEIIQDEYEYTTIWTDNMYLYYMTISNSVPLSEFEKILGSIKPVS